jgi:hypothetical protein
MDKIKAAQKLAEKLLDEACICQVGGDKGALKDEPESIKKSEEDTKKAMEMKQEAKISAMVDRISTYLGEGKDSKFSTDNRLQSMLHRAIFNKRKQKNPKEKPMEESEKMSAERIARRQKMLKDLKNFVKLKKKPIKESDEEQAKILSMIDTISVYLGEEKEVKVSDVPKDKQKIFKINRGKAREKGGPLTKAEKGGKPVKEANQVKIAQQKDTLLDNNERIVKDKVDKDTCLDPVPTVESDKMIDESIKDIFKRISGSKDTNHKALIDQWKEKRKSSKKQMKENLNQVVEEHDKIQQEGWLDSLKKTMRKNKKSVGNSILKRKDMLAQASKPTGKNG